jgi:hypothetical protein
MMGLSKKWRQPLQSRETKHRNEKRPVERAMKVSPDRSLFEKLAGIFDGFISGGSV